MATNKLNDKTHIVRALREINTFKDLDQRGISIRRVEEDVCGGDVQAAAVPGEGDGTASIYNLSQGRGCDKATRCASFEV